MNIEQKLTLFYRDRVMHNLIQTEIDLNEFIIVTNYEGRGELTDPIRNALIAIERIKKEMEKIG